MDEPFVRTTGGHVIAERHAPRGFPVALPPALATILALAVAPNASALRSTPADTYVTNGTVLAIAPTAKATWAATPWNPDAQGRVRDLALGPDNSLWVGGDFNGFRTVPQSGIARFKR